MEKSFFRKYLKYKKKYDELKNTNQRGGDGNIEHLCELLYNNVNIIHTGIALQMSIYDPKYDVNAPENIKKYTGGNGWSNYFNIINTGNRMVDSYDIVPKPLLKSIINTKNSRDQTPLYLATRFTSLVTIKILIDAKAVANFDDLRTSPLSGLLWKQTENPDTDIILGRKINLLVENNLINELEFITYMKYLLSDCLTDIQCGNIMRKINLDMITDEALTQSPLYLLLSLDGKDSTILDENLGKEIKEYFNNELITDEHLSIYIKNLLTILTDEECGNIMRILVTKNKLI